MTLLSGVTVYTEEKENNELIFVDREDFNFLRKGLGCRIPLFRWNKNHRAWHPLVAQTILMACSIFEIKRISIGGVWRISNALSWVVLQISLWSWAYWIYGIPEICKVLQVKKVNSTWGKFWKFDNTTKHLDIVILLEQKMPAYEKFPTRGIIVGNACKRISSAFVRQEHESYSDLCVPRLFVVSCDAYFLMKKKLKKMMN